MQSSKSLILSLMILFQSLCWSHQSPLITYISPQQIKEMGERVQLICIINDVGNYSPSWSKRHRDHPSDSLAMAIKTTPSIGDDRYNISLESNDTTTKYIFEINDIRSSDMGIYECQVITSSSEKITSSVELLVRHPPIISETQTTSVVTIAEGRPTRLTCIAEGYPRPRISWKREYNAIMPTGGQTFNGPSIEIMSAHKTDRGMYYCIADNGVGEPDQKAINLEVEFAPKIRATRPKVAQALHYDVELECKVEAYPPPSVFWFKDGVQLSTNRDYRITQMATTFEITNSILRVLSVDPQNYGDYFCNATNKMGHDAARLNLFAIETPDINYPGLQWVNSAGTTRSSLLHRVLLFEFITIFALLIS